MRTDRQDSSKSKSSPGLFGALALTVFAIAVSKLYATPFVLLYPDFRDLHPLLLKAILFISLVILWLILILIASKRAARPIKSVLKLKSFPKSIIGPLMLTVVGIIVVNLKLKDVIFQVVGGQGVLQAPQDMAFHIAVSIVMAPLFEEFLHRGIILDSFLQRYSRGKALLLSSVFFTIGHASWMASPEFFLTGIFLGYWYVLTRSLWVSILAHALVNLLGHHISCALCGLDPSTEFPQVVPPGEPNWLLALLGVALLGIGFYFGDSKMRESKG